MSISSRIEAMEGHIEDIYDTLELGGSDLTNVNKNIVNINEEVKKQYKYFLANGTDELWNNWPKVTGTGSDLSLTPTLKGALGIVPLGNCEQDTLPSEYQAVEYIESDGNQYIDTQYKGSLGVKFIAKFTRLSYFTQFFSAYTDSSNRLYAITTDTSNTNKVRFSFNQYDFYNYDIGTITDIVAESYIGINNQYIKINDNIAYNTNYTLNNWKNEKNLYLFWTNGVNLQKSSSRLYYAKVYENDVLVHNYIPCYRKSDTVIGMYDLVNNVFYTNAGTGTFTKGSDVSIPNPDYPQDIKVVTGDNQVVVQNKNLVTSALRSGNILFLNGTTLEDFNVDYKFKAGTYTFSFVNSNNPNIYINGVNRGNIQPLTFTMNEDFNIWLYRSGMTDNETTDIQLEVGSSATSYVVHQEQSYTLHLGDEYLANIPNTDYKDEIDVVNKKIIRKVGKVDLSNYTYDSHPIGGTSYNRRTTNQIPNIKYVSVNTELGNGLCEKYINHTGQGMSGVGAYNCFAIDVSLFQVTSIESPTGLFYYALATPTEETITDTTLINELNGLQELLSYDGTTNFTITSNNNNAQMLVQVSALKGE